MELWLTERETDHLEIRCRITRTLHRERSPYQEIVLAESAELGRMLLLDGIVQTTERDEFIYHEMLAHVPLCVHPRPERCLVIGGGDGGTVREVVRHPEVQEVHLVEIDRRVVELSREHLPSLSCGLDDPRVRVTYDDGIRYLAGVEERYDVILVDSSDPLGPAEGLFRTEFYRSAAAALREGGVFAAQTESPFFNSQLVRDIYERIAGAFPGAWLYLAPVPIYSLGPWSFTCATKGPDPTEPRRVPAGIETRYYSEAIHRAAFTLPPVIHEVLAAEAAGKSARP